MIHSGLVSITFRKLSPGEIVAAVKQAGLRGIEWGGDVHVPHGDLAAARTVRALTDEAGLAVAAYGSYYRVGRSEADGLPFGRVLETAVALGAPTIRVWPGTAASPETDEATRAMIGAELHRIAELAAGAGVTVALEYHANTLTDTDESAARLLAEVPHPHLFTLWQPHNGIAPAINLAGLEQVKARVSNLHVFHWGATSQDRRPLAEGAAVWAHYLAAIAAQGGERYALLEFVAGDTLESF